MLPNFKPWNASRSGQWPRRSVGCRQKQEWALDNKTGASFTPWTAAPLHHVAAVAERTSGAMPPLRVRSGGSFLVSIGSVLRFFFGIATSENGTLLKSKPDFRNRNFLTRAYA